MRSLVMGAILTAILAACGSQPGTVFSTTVLDSNGELPLPVALRDTSGLVIAIGPAQFDSGDFRDAGVLADPAGAAAFILTWLGGMCDSDTALVFESAGSGYDMQLAIHEKLGFGCPAAGILRGVRVETSQPIPVVKITISGSKAIQLILDEDCGPLRAAATDDAKIACFAFIGATIGDRREEFARVTVTPDDGSCPGTECATAAGIAGQLWRVDATDRKGQQHAWRCAYRDETASCSDLKP